MLLTSPLDDLKTALLTFERELNNNLQWLWVRLVLPPLIRGSAWQEEGEAVESPNSIAATTLRNWVTSVLRNWLASRMVDPGGNGPHPQRELGVKAREALIVANLPSDTLIQVLVGEEFDDPAIWLDENLLGSLLGDAVVAGHASAMSAADQLISDPTRFGTSLARRSKYLSVWLHSLMIAEIASFDASHCRVQSRPNADVVPTLKCFL